MSIARMTLTALALVAILCAAEAFGSAIWYTAEADGSDGWSHLYSADTTTGAITDRGEVNGQKYITDLAMAEDGTLYGVGWTKVNVKDKGKDAGKVKAKGDSKLYKIIPGGPAGWETIVVNSKKMEKAVTAAVMSEGALYVASQSGKLQKMAFDVDHDRWSVVKKGSLGYGCGDLAFSTNGEKLYAALEGGYVGTVNFDASSKEFGEVTIVGHSGYEELSGLATVGNQLYATTNTANGYGESKLVKIDTIGGSAYEEVNLTNGIANNIWGATSTRTTPVPEPMTQLMLSVGGFFVLFFRRRKRSLA